MKSNEEINIIHQTEKSFYANRFIVGVQLKEGQRIRWPLHAMREWSLTPASGHGILKSLQQLKILIEKYEVIVSGNHLDAIDEVFCEGSGGDFIEQGSRYTEISKAKPFVAQIEVRDTTSLFHI